MGADEQKSTRKRSSVRGGFPAATGGTSTIGVGTPEGIDAEADAQPMGSGSSKRNDVKSPNPNRTPGQTRDGHPRGYNCKKCGKLHDFSLWVFAHWSEDLIHVCDCGQSHIIRRGIARKGR